MDCTAAPVPFVKPGVKICVAEAAHAENLRASRRRALDQVRTTLSMIKDSLVTTRRESRVTTVKVREPIASKLATARSIPVPVEGDAVAQATTDPVLDLLTTENVDDIVQVLQRMNNSAGSVIDNFDEVFVQNYLDEFSPGIDLAPAIGLQGRTLLYSKHIFQDGTSTRAFTTFDDLPSDAPEDLSDAKVFPFNGDTFLVIGHGMWKKARREVHDMALVGAATDWTVIHQRGWEKVGDAVLPADVVDIVYYGELNGFNILGSEKEINPQMQLRLLLLHEDSHLSLIQEDSSFTANIGAPTPLNFRGSESSSAAGIPSAGSSPQVAPLWEKIAFSDGVVYGLENNFLWIMDIDLSDNSYTIKTRTAVGEVLEMTGTDAGLVVRRPDGLLYQRFVDVSGGEPDENFVYDFARSGDPPTGDVVADRADPGWTDVPDTLRVVGVSSPGANYTLRGLIGSLRARYLQTQTVLYPVVEKIKTFSFVHSYYLSYLRTVAEQYATTTPPDDVATEIGAIHSGHLQVWSSIVSNSIVTVEDAVARMAVEGADTASSIRVRVEVLQGDLEVIEQEIEDLEDELDTSSSFALKAHESTFELPLGILRDIGGREEVRKVRIVMMVLLMTSGLVIAGGLRLADGQIISAGFILLIKSGPLIREATFTMVDIEQAIIVAKAKAESMVATMEMLTTIADEYDNISASFSSLSDVWSGIGTRIAAIIGQANSLLLLGQYLLGASSLVAIDEFEAKNTQMSEACTAYLDLINSQGVQITSSSRFIDDSEGRAQDDSANAASQSVVISVSEGELTPVSAEQVRRNAADFVTAASFSESLLKAGDVTSYLKHLRQVITPKGQITATIRGGDIVLLRV